MMLRGGHVNARAVKVAVAVLALYAVSIGAYLGAGHSVRDYTDIGPRFIQLSQASSVISSAPILRYGEHHNAERDLGYDGQFYYFIALDPSRARHYIDSPPYRYERILYPMLVRFAALEQPAAVPWMMVIINWLAVGAGVLALAAWLARRGASPWLAALYGLFPGMLIAVQHDLTEPLAYGLVALAIYLFDFGGRRGVLLSGVAFGLAALCRETTLLFAVLFGLSIIAGRVNANPRSEVGARLRQTLGFFSLALTPFAAWLAVDYSWLGVPHPGTVDAVPFKGIFGPFNPTLQLAFVGIPALLFAATQLRRLGAREGRLERYCLLANTALAIVFSTNALWVNYMGIGRAGIAIVLAALLCMPSLATRASLTARGSYLRAVIPARIAFTLWMAPLAFVFYASFAGRLFNP
jgi:hypothetical protein